MKTAPALASRPADNQNLASRRTVLRSAISSPRLIQRIRLSRAVTPVAWPAARLVPLWSIAARTVIRLAFTEGKSAIRGGS
jgi:hypothetical protein